MCIRDRPSKRIRRVSPRQAERLKEYAKVKRQWLKTWWKCARRGCRVGAIHIHHKRGRAGKLLLATEYWIPLCAGCHEWVHRNPEAARKEGLLAARGDWGRQ